MKIAHLIHDDGSGGGPKTVLNHLSFYAKTHKVILFHGGHGILADFCESMGIAHRRIPLDRMGRSPLGFAYLYGHLRDKQPDLLVLHGQWAAFFGSIAGKLAGVSRMVYIGQWPSFYTDWDLLRVVRNYILEAFPCWLCETIIPISPGNRKEFLLRFPQFAKKILHFPNTVDFMNYRSLPLREPTRAELQWDTGSVHVVCMGRLSTQKRVDWLLQAWRRVEFDFPSAKLWIVGGGELSGELQSLADCLRLKNVTFLGAQPNPLRYLVASDLVAMPSMYEGHANVPLEAMACGRPIVACAVDGVRESFSDGVEGILVRPGDVAQFAEALLLLCRDANLRQQMGQAGLERVKVYDKKKIMLEYLAVMEG